MRADDLVVLEVPSTSTLARMAYDLRREVYIDEQGLPSDLGLDHDAFDAAAVQIVGIRQGEVAGTLRIVFLPEHARIGHVAVRPAQRHRGVARTMLEAAMQHCRARGQDRMFLTSQSDRTAVYETVGFAVFGEEIILAGLPHRTMKTY